MNLKFKELNCPCCSRKLSSGSTTIGMDARIVRFCEPCNFRMLIIIPNNEYDYFIETKKIKTS